MYFDSSLKLDGGGAGVLFISPKGEQLKYVFQILFKVSNNEAEYEALLHGLWLAVSLGIKRLLVYGDSLLVVQQVNKEWDINKDTMDAYVEEIRKLVNKFSGLEIHQVDRCWRCLSAIFTRQLYSIIKENYMPYSHICIANLAPQLFLSFVYFRWARAE